MVNGVFVLPDCRESPVRNWFEKEFKKLLKQRKDFGVVLDAGCGSRYYESWIKCKKYIGFDLPSNKFAEVKGDVHNLPFKNNSFDTVFALHIFYTLEDPVKALSEIKRVLKQNGFLIATFLSSSSRIGSVKETKNFFTEYKIQKLFCEWKSVEIIPVKGFLTNISTTIFRWSLNHNRFFRWILLPLRIIICFLPLFDKEDSRYAVSFLVRAVK